jgi:hypothetical protein
MSLDDLHGVSPVCNSWASLGSDPSRNLFVARYEDQRNLTSFDLPYKSLSSQHNVSPRGEFSIRSNVSSNLDDPRFVTGELTIGMNPDKTAKDALLSLAMQASSSTLRKDTNVCFAMHEDACDLAIYVSHLSK